MFFRTSLSITPYCYPIILALVAETPELVPEVQGTTQEVATEKCKRAAQLVSISI